MKANAITFDRIKKSPYRRLDGQKYFYVHRKDGITEKYDFSDKLVETIDYSKKNEQADTEYVPSVSGKDFLKWLNFMERIRQRNNHKQ